MRSMILTICITICMMPFSAFANHPGHSDHAHDSHHSHAHMEGDNAIEAIPGIEGADHIIAVQINGLVCDFCAIALERVFGKRPEVSGITIDLTTKLVSIGLKKEADIDDATITQLITNAGYNVVDIKR